MKLIKHAIFNWISYTIQALIYEIRGTIQRAAQKKQISIKQLCHYYDEIKALFKNEKGKIISSDEVSLPSPAVFMEPVLSHAKGAEMYDMKRNTHWDILHSPAIGVANPNQLRAQQITLSPNEPSSHLDIAPTPNHEMPTSISTALNEAGELDLSTLISSNANSLNTMLTGLASVATELAKASATLTGDAQKQALNSANEIAKQITETIGKTMKPMQTKPQPVPPSPAQVTPPQTQREKAEVLVEIINIDNGSGSPNQKKERKKAIGSPPKPETELEYQFSILFVDQFGFPYNPGDFTFTMSILSHETGERMQINAGHTIELDDNRNWFEDLLLVSIGRKITIEITAKIDSVDISGTYIMSAPNHKDIALTCSMKFEEREIQATSAHEAINTAIQTSSFSLGLGVLAQLHIGGNIEFPFGITTIGLNASGNAQPDFKAEYNNSTTDSTTSSTSESTATTYKVKLPLNGWEIKHS